MDELCLNPLFLWFIYYFNVFIKIIRFAVPILLIVKLTIDMVKQIVDPTKDDGKRIITRRIIWGLVIFLVPLIVQVFFSLFSKAFNIDANASLNVCLEFANPEYINVMQDKLTDEEMNLYLSSKQLNLSKNEQYIESVRSIVKSRSILNGVGSNANNKNMIKCGSGPNYNTELFNAVRSAGYKTREGVVAAALYLSSYADVHIPYFWAGGHAHSYNGYKDAGSNFYGIPSKWGCDVKMQFGGTNKQKDGVNYPFGMDCSGFINWAILNGGYYDGSDSQHVYVATKQTVFKSIAGISLPSVKVANAKGKITPGDIAFKSGHVGMVVEVHDDYFMVAEEKGYDYGLVVSKVKYDRFSDIVLMDNFYNNYKKDVPLFSGFK